MSGTGFFLLIWERQLRRQKYYADPIKRKAPHEHAVVRGSRWAYTVDYYVHLYWIRRNLIRVWSNACQLGSLPDNYLDALSIGTGEQESQIVSLSLEHETKR